MISVKTNALHKKYYLPVNKTMYMFVRRVDEDHSSHLGVVGAGSGECADS